MLKCRTVVFKCDALTSAKTVLESNKCTVYSEYRRLRVCAFIDLPCTVKLNAECYRLVGHEFGGSPEVSVLEDSFGKRFFKCSMCAAPIQWSMLFSVVQLDDRILLRYGKWSTCSRWVSPIKMLKTGRGVFVAAGKYLSLFDVYGEVKTTVSIAELVDRLLQVISRIAGSSIVICILALCDGSGTSMLM